MGDGIAIRCYGDPVDWEYGGANELLHEFAHWSDIPILNMEDDKYHPFQALADVMTVKEKFGAFKGTKFVMSWAYSPSIHKPRAVPQSAIIGATMVGCDTVLAHPPEFDLDPDVIAACEANAAMNGSSFTITHDFESAFEGAHVVYPKAWAPKVFFKPPVGEDDEASAVAINDGYKSWKMTSELMETADREAIYMHCLPADRGWEVNNDVMDRTDPGSGWSSAIYDEAENRMHAQKAVMALLMGGK
jgi:N-acetylornithine carbamoyltransferase